MLAKLMLMMLVWLGNGPADGDASEACPADVHDAGPPLVLPRRSGGLMLVMLGIGPADAHDAGPPFVLSPRSGRLGTAEEGPLSGLSVHKTELLFGTLS